MQDASHPVHRLLERLLNERLRTIQALAQQEETGGISSSDLIRGLAELQLVITAIRDEIARHEVSLGHGSEKTLA